MTRTTIFLVMGEWNEQTWPVHAYTDSAQAQAHAAAANGWRQEMQEEVQRQIARSSGAGRTWRERYDAAMVWYNSQRNPYDTTDDASYIPPADYTVREVPCD